MQKGTPFRYADESTTFSIASSENFWVHGWVVQPTPSYHHTPKTWLGELKKGAHFYDSMSKGEILAGISVSRMWTASRKMFKGPFFFTNFPPVNSCTKVIDYVSIQLTFRMKGNVVRCLDILREKLYWESSQLQQLTQQNSFSLWESWNIILECCTLESTLHCIYTDLLFELCIKSIVNFR